MPASLPQLLANVITSLRSYNDDDDVPDTIASLKVHTFDYNKV